MHEGFENGIHLLWISNSLVLVFSMIPTVSALLLAVVLENNIIEDYNRKNRKVFTTIVI